MKAKCDRECFSCPYADCIVDDVSMEEYKDIDNRDKEIYKSRGERLFEVISETKYSKTYYQIHKEYLNKKAKDRYHRKKTGGV